jgi:hypothetical protein
MLDNERSMPGTTWMVYTLPLRFSGLFDRGALESSFEAVVRSHALLRTTLSLTQSVGRVGDVVPAIELIDLSSERDPTTALRRRITEATSVPLDLERGPLFLGVLYRLGETEHVLMIRFHHILFELAGAALVVREVLERYAAAALGRPQPAKASAALEFRDYARWQRAWLGGDELERILAYWRRHLEGACPVELPTDRPRPGTHAMVANAFRAIGRGVAEAVQRFSEQASYAPSIVYLAALNGLLCERTGREDVVVRTVSNTRRRETMQVIGLFDTLLPIRTRIAGSPTARQILRRTRAAFQMAHDHLDAPFWRAFPPDLRAANDIVFNYTPARLGTFDFVPEELAEAGTRVSFEDVEQAPTAGKYETVFFVTDDKDGISVRVEYKTALFDAPTIARLLEDYERWIVRLVEEAGKPDDTASRR